MAFKYDQYNQKLPGKTFLYGNASHGFYDTLIWLQENKPKNKPNIVMPVYIPAKLYRFVIAAGYEPIFYDVNMNCGFDPEQVMSLINNQTQAVLAIHYFGLPCPVQELKTLTESKDVFLIEDCVHTLNSSDNGKLLGTIGDGAMFSARKMLQLPSGGIFVLNNEEHCSGNFQPSYKIRVRSIYTGYYLLTSRIKYAYFNLTRGYDPLGLAWIPGTGYIDFSDEQVVTTRKMSHLSKAYLRSIDIDKVAHQRRFNYNYLLNQIKDMEFLQPIYPEKFHKKIEDGKTSNLQLKDGITPYSFPVLTPPGNRSGLRQSLCNAGIGCGAGWPETPFHHKEFTNTKELANRLLEIPIHQGISVYQLERVVTCLKEYELKMKMSTSLIFENHKKTVALNTNV